MHACHSGARLDMRLGRGACVAYRMWPRVSTLYLKAARETVQRDGGGGGGGGGGGVLHDERHVGGEGESDLAGQRGGAGEEVQISAGA
jgi:hypothetical protein